MSQVLDTKVVEMQFDNSKFEKNVEVSLNSLKNLNKSIDDAGKNKNSLDALAKAGDQVGVSFDNMNMKSRISLNMMDMLAGVGTKAFNRISDAVAGFAMNMANSLSGMQAMRDGFAEYELKMGSVQTILNGAKMLDANGKNIKDEATRLDIVNQKLQELNAYSDKTIYSFKDMTANIGKFTNAGVNLDDSVAAIQGVANVAAISGANAQEASRAMYNFSQALSSGAVKLIDWKSIENANMATVDFKQQLLNTALVMGTVVKEGKKYVSTTTDAKGKVSDAFTATSKFNDSLSAQWMTTEVLTQTLKNYSTDVREMTDGELEDYRKSLLEIGYTTKQVDSIIETSRKAFESATEVKTFTQMIDTLKESLGSGWAQTWEIVLGDFKEAKELWTGLNNTIDGLLSPIGKTRNAILQFWKDAGGRTSVIQGFKNLYSVIGNLVAPLKKVWKAFTPGVKTSGTVLFKISQYFENFTAKLVKVSEVVSKVLTRLLKPVVTFGKFISEQLLKVPKLVNKFAGGLKKYLEPAAKAIKTFTKGIYDIANSKVISKIKAFRDTMTNTAQKLKTTLQNSERIKELRDSFDELKTSIKDIFNKVVPTASANAKKFAKYIGQLWDAIRPLASKLLTPLKLLAGGIFASISKAVEKLSKVFKNLKKTFDSIDLKNTKVYKFLSDLPNKLKNLQNNATLKSMASSIKSFGSEALTYLSGKFDSLKISLDSIHMPEGLKNVFDGITNFIKGIFGSDSIGSTLDTLTGSLEKTTEATEKLTGGENAEKLTTFQKFLEKTGEAFDFIKNGAERARTALENFFDFIKTNTPKAISAIHAFLAGDDGIFTLSDISDIVYTVSDALSMLLTSKGIADVGVAAKNISDAFGNLTESITTLLKRTSNKMKMSALKDFAISIGILAGALFVLSLIPVDKLAMASVVIVGLAGALTMFFDVISTGNMNLAKTAGFLPIAGLILAIGVAMVAMAASLGILVGALAAFPSVIKSYNKLGDEFATGMERVKEVLTEIYSYLDHTVNTSSFGAAVSLLALVVSLKSLTKTIKMFSKMDEAELSEGLSRIKQVVTMLGDFLGSISLTNINIINIGANLDTLGMGVVIWALGSMLTKIAPVISDLAKLKEDEFKTAFDSLKKIFTYLGTFMVAMGTMGVITSLGGTGLGTWLGIAANIALLGSTIGDIVDSLKTLTEVVGSDPESFKKALSTLQIIFIELAGVLFIIGKFEPSASVATLFGLSLVIGVLTLCVYALVPLAKNHPAELESAVGALGGLMLALGGALALAGLAAGKTTVKDILVLIAMAGMMLILTQALRRLARIGDSDSLVGAGLAISGALLSLGGAIAMLNGVQLHWTVIVALGALALAIWGVAYAIAAFKGSAGGMTEGAAKVTEAGEQMEGSMEQTTNNMAAFAKDALPSIITELGASFGTKIKELLQNFSFEDVIRGWVNGIKARAKSFAQDFIDIGTNLMDGIATALENPANIERIKGCIKAVGVALLDAFKAFFGINSPSTVMSEQGGFILDGLVQGLMEFPSKLADWVKGIGEFILGGISGFFKGAAEKGKTLANKIGSGIQNGKKFVTKKAKDLGSAALKKVGQAKEWGAHALKSANSFGQKLQQSKNPVQKAAGSMIVGATNLVSKVGSSFSSYASGAAALFAAKIRAGDGPAKAAGAVIVRSAKAAFRGISNAFHKFGTNAAQGFRNGIKSFAAKAAAEAAAMVRKAKEAAKNEQNSSSPSKDFMEYGGWAAEGYAIGLTNRKSIRLVEKNARAMVDTAKNAALGTKLGSQSLYLDSNPALTSLGYAMSQISDTLDSNLNTSPTIRPVVDMSNVNRNASAISTLFGDERFTVNATRHIQRDFDRTMANRNGLMSMKSIDKLANKLNEVTDAMNSRSMNNYFTVEGAEDPMLVANQIVRNLKMKARTI